MKRKPLPVTGSCVKRPSISELIWGGCGTPMSEIEGQASPDSELRITVAWERGSEVRDSVVQSPEVGMRGLLSPSSAAHTGT